MLASAAVLVQPSALYLLFLREILSMRSMQTHVSIAVLAQASALYLLFLRVNQQHDHVIK